MTGDAVLVDLPCQCRGCSCPPISCIVVAEPPPWFRGSTPRANCQSDVGRNGGELPLLGW